MIILWLVFVSKPLYSSPTKTNKIVNVQSFKFISLSVHQKTKFLLHVLDQEQTKQTRKKETESASAFRDYKSYVVSRSQNIVLQLM